MSQKMIALAFGFLWLACAATQVQAQQSAQCGERSKVLEVLSGKYGETRRSIGLAANASVVEVFASATGSWTITVTLPSGVTCLVASGENYEAVTEELPAKGAPV